MIRKLVYRCEDGILLANIPIESEHEYLYNFNTNYILIDDDFIGLMDYRVMNNELVELTDIEIVEIRKYGKILTDEDRLLNKLKPSVDEIRKAESTIEVLTLIQEVI